MPDQTEHDQAGPLAVPDGSGVAGSPVLARERPTPRPRIELCPYCGRESVNTTRCAHCGGRFDALSRQATQNAMGPWWLREGDRPVKPGCSFETIRTMVARGVITAETVLRGPTTRQFWTRARRAPGVANLLGMCHSCQRSVEPGAFMCPACGASFQPDTDRQHLGLSPVALLPGQAAAERIAAVSAPTPPPPGSGGYPGTPESRVDAGVSAPGWEGGPVQAVWRGGPRLSAADVVEVEPGLREEVSFPPIGRHSKRRGTLGQAAGLLIVGGLMGLIIGAATLVAVHGDVPTALNAVGLGEPSGTGRAAAGPGGEVGPGDPGGQGAQEPRPAEPVGVAGGRAEGPDDAAPVPDVEGGRQDQPEPSVGESEWAQIMALLERGGPEDLTRVLTIVSRLERDGRLSGSEAAAWRAAIEARRERALWSSLP